MNYRETKIEVRIAVEHQTTNGHTQACTFRISKKRSSILRQQAGTRGIKKFWVEVLDGSRNN